MQVITQTTPTLTGHTGWLTVERVAYLTLALLAAGLRFFQLGLHPLAPAEAEQALAAWQLAHAQAPTLTGQISPLLLSLDRLVFLLTLGSDALARFWPAVFGALLTLLPYALRPALGRPSALLSALLLTFSPTAVHFSRQAGGASLALFGALLALVAIARSLDNTSPSAAPRWSAVTGIGLAIALASASAGLTGVLALALGLALFARPAIPDLAVRLRRGAPHLLTAALLVFVGGSTFLLIFWPGLGAAADLLAHWFAHFRPAAGAPPFWHPLLRLLVEEPLVLLPALAALIAWAANPAFRQHLSWPLKIAALWGGLALLLTLLGRQPADHLSVVVPWALLAAHALAFFLARLHTDAAWSEEWYLLLSGLTLLIAFSLFLAAFTQTGQVPYLVGALALPGIFIVLCVASGFWIGPRATLDVLAIFAIIAFGLLQLGRVWTLSHDNRPPRQAQLPYLTVTSPDVRTLAQTLADRSAHRYGDERRFQIDIVAGPSANTLRWYTRSFQRTRLVTAPLAEAGVDAVIVPLAPDGAQTVAADPVPPGPGFIGAPFALTRRWTPQDLSAAQFTRWLLQGLAERDIIAASDKQDVILWLQTARSD